ncbi:hypothetical protein R1flu_010434 [Riccia fluitans]|uniref:Uncharacterized protein n=1 Tax=Riccia fluitans TaxID=41844 RepID=A0ABD1Z7Z8_9MARC
MKKVVETLSVHAYIAKTQHEALVEEKRRREDIGEGTSTKRQTRSDSRLEKSRQDFLPTDVPMAESTSKLATKEKATTKEKGKDPAYKLQSDIEAATDLKELAGESALVNVLDTIVSREEEELVVVCQQSAQKGKNLLVRWADDEEEEGKVPTSLFTRNYWARSITETLVRLERLDKLVVALIDNGSEINIVSKNLYKKVKWPISTDLGWMIREQTMLEELCMGHVQT